MRSNVTSARGPKPLFLAVGVALAWAVLFVGPVKLFDDVRAVIPSDFVSTPSRCYPTGAGVSAGWVGQESGNKCIFTSPYVKWATESNLMAPRCFETASTLESDGYCHRRTASSLGPLLGDLLQAGQQAVLAFVVVGAALLLIPRLRDAGPR